MSDIRICGYCQERIRGRSDKKFCNDVCRNAYNNRLNGAVNSAIREVNSKLKRNRRILERLFPLDSPFIKISKQALLNRGFQLCFHTHMNLSPKGSVYYFCYEYGYTLLGEDVVVVKKTGWTD